VLVVRKFPLRITGSHNLLIAAVLYGTLSDFITPRTTFADQEMPKYAKICQETKGKIKMIKILFICHGTTPTS
jgi:hypothetical protein